MRWQTGCAPVLLAHRGAPAADLPENAVATWDAAWNAAPCWIEIDVYPTADGVYVLNHDRTLDRSTSGEGELMAHTWEQLQQLRLRSRDGALTAHHMSTFDQAIEWARDRTVLFLDVKGGRENIAPMLAYAAARDALQFMVTLTYCIEDTLAVHAAQPEAMVYGRATDRAYAEELLGCGIPHDRLVAWIHETEPAVFERLHASGIRTTFGTFLEVDHQPEELGFRLYHDRLAAGADILNTDDVPRAAAAIVALARSI
jgi:glycerophosphoryl diester phosphodiesterase